MQGEFLKGFEFGGGIFAVGSRTGDLNNSYDANGYYRLDAFARYHITENLQISLNVDNVLDKEFIENTDLQTGAPRSEFVAVKMDF